MPGAVRIAVMTVATCVAALAVALPSPALAAPVAKAAPSRPATPAAKPSRVATPAAKASKVATPPPYALEFTLPTYGKAGCLVCHGDANLVVSASRGNRSFWVDPKRYANGAHATILCTGCHLDYGYTAPHRAPGDSAATAKQACKGCHADEFREYSAGAHAIRPLAAGKPDPKAARKPLCGDCHGGHDISLLTTAAPAAQLAAARASLHGTGEAMCGRAGCHPDFWANFEDYYHGKAYKRGAEDAPACWDCHGAHTVLPSKNKLSSTNRDHLGETCGVKGCHEGANENYVSYVELIHGRRKVLDSNPVYAAVTGMLGAIGDLFGR